MTRANPLCIDNNDGNKAKEAALMRKLDLDGSSEAGTRSETSRKLEEDFFSLSTLSMDDKVQRFLLHAVELAKQNSRTKTVKLEPTPIYGSVIA